MRRPPQGYSVMAAPRTPLPEAFRAPRVLRWLNILAVGSSLSAATGLVLGTFMGASVALASSVSTLFFGVAWARIVRIRRRGRPVGWLVAVPLASMNAGAAFCIDRIDPASPFSLSHIVTAFVVGATVGVFVWGPALVVTLALFGAPLYKAQRAADHGLWSEDRGERFVGGVAAGIAALAVVAMPFAASVVSRRATEWAGEGAPELPAPLPVVWLCVLAACGLAAGLAAVILATRRERARRLFVADVDRGAETRYRIDPQPDGASLLVRIDSTEGGHYRTPRFVEPVVELDPRGEARRTLEHL